MQNMIFIEYCYEFDILKVENTLIYKKKLKAIRVFTLNPYSFLDFIKKNSILDNR